MKLKVGDRVKQIAYVDEWEDPYAIITKIEDGDMIYHQHLNVTNESRVRGKENFVLVKGEPMSKYEDLKERITELDKDTTIKELDDILEELHLDLDESRNIHTKRIRVYNQEVGWSQKGIYTTQCEKLEVLKEALLWALDKSNIKKDLKGTTQKVEIEGKIYKAKILDEA